MDFKETEGEGMLRIQMAQDAFRYLAIVIRKFNEFLDESRGPLKRQSAATSSVSKFPSGTPSKIFSNL